MTQDGQSRAFEKLHPKVQYWIWQQHWTGLREAQEEAVDPILSGERDVIIASATASGKTEAAFLPIGSRLASEPSADGLALYVSPLKALINDEFARLGPFFEHLGFPSYPWHGDIAASIKKHFRKEPRGVLLITPESLEGFFVIQGFYIHSIFRNLRFVVVDELHSFISAERGKQLQSLLHRLEFAIRRRVPRIGLSATLGDMALAADFLRPGSGGDVLQIVSSITGQEIKLIIRGYEAGTPKLSVGKSGAPMDGADENDPAGGDNATLAIGEDIFKSLRGSSNLAFANSRSNVEKYADLLRRRCESERLPNEFWPHHGSLSKDLRESVEAALKDKARPATAICTSTLELGIDIGSVKSVAQIGAPYSVASLRQRLGRSGRRGEPAILRLYIEENEITDRSSHADELRLRLVQAVAIVRLLLARWCEPPTPGGLHLSTLTHQILSVIAQHGGVTASQAWQELCRDGPFPGVEPAMFERLLRGHAAKNLILQSSDGALLHAPVGEKIVNHYSFYTVFVTPEEYRILAGERTLGTLPVDRPLQENSFIIFGGRRWRIVSVDEQKKIIEVTAASGGRVPMFDGLGGCLHDRVRKEMLAVYRETAIPQFLDATAARLLREGRSNFARYGLHEKSLVSCGTATLLFVWAGDRIIDTIEAQLRSMGFSVTNERGPLRIEKIEPDSLSQRLKEIVAKGPADPIALSRSIRNKLIEKYDGFLPEDLLCEDYGRSRLDTEGAWIALKEVVGE
jgi:ATP-dependent Lhr-like helicase